MYVWTLMDTYGQKYGYQPGDTGLESKDTLAATAGAAAAGAAGAATAATAAAGAAATAGAAAADASHSDC